MPFSLRSCDYSVTDAPAHDISNFLRKRFGDHRLIHNQPNLKRSALKYKQFGPFEISEYCYGCAVKIDVRSLGDVYHLQIVLNGCCTWSRNEESIYLDRGDSLVLTPYEQYSMDYSADCTILTIKIPHDFLRQSAREFGYLVTSKAICFNRRALPFKDTIALHNLLADILDQEYSESFERVSFYYTKLLSNAILSIYGRNVGQCPGLPPSTHRHIKLIHHYVLENIAGDIKLEELAHLCRISRKSLYNLFKREIGITPSTYVRQIKLESVCSELTANLSIRNITEVALEYGFTNLGRFSAQYREYIGELPSETLKRLGRYASRVTHEK